MVGLYAWSKAYRSGQLGKSDHAAKSGLSHVWLTNVTICRARQIFPPAQGQYARRADRLLVPSLKK